MNRWLDDRIPLHKILKFLGNKTVPRHRYTFHYLFGGLALMFFAIQLLSGLLLTLYYIPTPEAAHESVRRIMNEVSFGWLMRSIHHWSAHLMVLMTLVHLAGKYFFQAYRAPREITWFSGIILLTLVLGFAFTGYLLPWDMKGYFATQIGTEIPRSVPLLGEWLVDILRGGEYIDGTTLTRIFSLHAIILPVVTVLVIVFHLIQNQHTGSGSPRGVEVRGGIPFYPDFMYRDLIAWICGLLILLSVVMLFPVPLGEKADIFASPPVGIRPEWYFLPLFQTIRMLPGSILGVDTDFLVNIGVAGILGWVICLPWLHKESSSESTHRFYRMLGVASILYFIITAVLGILI